MSDAPQVCPSCGRSLADPSVPPEYAQYATQFSIALSGHDARSGKPVWRCPFCLHAWPKTIGLDDLRYETARRQARPVPVMNRAARRRAGVARRR